MKYNPQIVSAYYVQSGLPAPVFEHRFHHTRKWRLDIAWPDHKLAVEVQGGIFIQGRHSRGAAMLKEWEKLNALAVMRWRVMYCQPKDVCTIEFVTRLIDALDKKQESVKSGGIKLRCKGCGKILRATKDGWIMPCKKCLNIAHARGVHDGILIEQGAENIKQKRMA